MQKHFLALFFLAGWGFFTPASWLGSIRAQTVTGITLSSGTFGPTSFSSATANPYTGAAAGAQLGTPTGGWAGHTQNWFSVSLQGGLTYAFAYHMSNGNANNNAVLSVQNGSGTQVAFYGSSHPRSCVAFTPSADGTYTIICSRNGTATTAEAFTLAVFPLITPVTIPVSGKYSASFTFSPSSYQGNGNSAQGFGAFSNIGTPNGGNTVGWGNHEQVWYSVSLTAGLTYTFTETMSGDPDDNAVLSIQNSSGQVAFNPGTTPSSTLTYTPTVSGTYLIIWSRNGTGNLTSAATVSISVPATPTTTTIVAPSILYPNNGSVTVTVSDASAIPTGSVTLSVDGGAGITQALVGGSTVFTLPGLFIGTHTLSAGYAAQPGFSASSGTGSLTVIFTSTETAITAPPVNYPFNASVTVAVSDPSATPTGSVTLSVDGGPNMTQTLASGSTIFTVPGLGIGTHTLSASYPTQPGFAASSSTSTVVINPPLALTIPVSMLGSLSVSSYKGNAASTALSFSQDAWNPSASFQDWYTVTLSAGETYTISVETTGDSFLSIQNSSGTQIAWNDDAGLSMLGSPLASQIVFTPTSTGVYTIIVSTGALSAGSPLSYTLTIPLPLVSESTTTIISSVPGALHAATVTVKVTAASGTPTGSVTLSVDGGPGTTHMLSGGSTTFSLTGLSFGIHTLSASYSGASGFLSSSSSGSLILGIPNAKLAPPAGLNREFLALEVSRPALQRCPADERRRSCSIGCRDSLFAPG